MGCWVITNQHGRLSLTFRYRGRQWRRSLDLDARDAQARRRAEALAAHCAALMQRGCLEVEYARIFEGDTRFQAPRAPRVEGTAPLLRTWAATVMAERVPPLYRPAYARALDTHWTRWIGPALGHRPLDDITREDVVALRQAVIAQARRGKGGSIKYARNVLASLQALLTEARERGLIAVSPADGLRWPRAEQQDPDPLAREELESVLGYLRARDPHAYRFVLCLADTGLRPSEAAALTWGDVELEGGGALSVRRSRVGGSSGGTKTRASRRTLRPVSARLLTVLRASKPLRVTPETPVFTGRRGAQMRQENFTPRKWQAALRALSIRPRRLYDTRATFISLALSAGANPQWLAEYTGTSLTMFARHYARFLPPADGAALLGHIPGGAEIATPAGESVAPPAQKSRRRQG